MFVVDRKHFSEITSVREHRNVYVALATYFIADITQLFHTH